MRRFYYCSIAFLCISPALSAPSLVAPSLVAPSLVFPSLVAPNLLANGSFESDFAGWTQAQNIADTGVESTPYDGFNAENGADYALLGPVGRDGTLSQTFSDTGGTTLAVSFWLANDGSLPNDFTANIGGTTLLQLADAGRFGWTEYTGTVTATGTDTITFGFRNDPGYFALDNVSVSEIPEPATFMLLPMGMLAMIAWRKGKVRKLGGQSLSPQTPRRI